MNQDSRIEITNKINKLIQDTFSDFKELNKRYNIPIGVILIQSSSCIKKDDLLRTTDKVLCIEHDGYRYSIIFTFFTEGDSLYNVVKKIELKYQDSLVYFENIKESPREHVKDFIDSIFFKSED